MKKITMLLLIFCFTTILFSQSGEKTLVKSFNLEGQDQIALALKGSVEVQHWNNPLLRIHITVSLENNNDAVLKSLIQAGRYFLKYEIGDIEAQIFAPNMEKEVTVRGVALQEKISYVVYAPENVTMKLVDKTTSSIDWNLKDRSQDKK